MKRAFGLAVAAAVVAGVTGCGSARPQTATRHQGIAIAANLPPSPATWPKYPHFSQHSCSGQPAPAGNRPGEQQYAPSYAPAPRAHPTPPAEIVRRFLARFGDRRYVGSVTFPVSMNGRPRSTEVLGAIIHAPRARDTSNAASAAPHYTLAHGIANWEMALAFGALRDDFCAAGGPTLAAGTADELNALGQRFPNPSPAVFRRRVALVAKRFGFHVVSLRLLHPEQRAPLLVVRTNRPRADFSQDVPMILSILDPTSHTRDRTAETFEGFFFAVEDSGGLFLSTENVFRGEVQGGQWAASESLYPFAHG